MVNGEWNCDVEKIVERLSKYLLDILILIYDTLFSHRSYHRAPHNFEFVFMCLAF
jgi:hypothetical protein